MKTILFILFSVYAFAQIGTKVQTSKPQLIGKWSNNEFGFAMVLELNSDGSGNFDGERISYTSTPSTLSVKQDGETTIYKYLLQNNKLTLSGGDLDAPITFSKGTSSVNSTPNITTNANADIPKTSAIAPANLLGTWSVNGETVVFKNDKTGTYNGNPFRYSVAGNTLTTSGNTGTTVFTFAVNGNYLTLIGGGVNVVMQRGNASNSQSNTYGKSSGGGIDQSIVGKWCWANTSSTYSSSYNSSKCIVINANGSYEYYAEGSISGYGGGGYGGSSSQSADRGTWRLEGNRIHVQSQAEGYKVYSFEKRNHPKNGDPMIVIDGDTYVSYYQKAPWR
ncbi:hypothetical protein GCM10011514_21870 [Emticicia aquatilis]|uniref:Lipocalin-like domain-containing protein n=1 Tax=Emticicia aquatilis TaxID=1537369 RepID=A0A916YR22_9BACT|nr:hypothetical protein [Emticicia aquatilis]GGD57400.1 hypothetical protein GCM10011514_21870 [Emticicia aquatilis]